MKPSEERTLKNLERRSEIHLEAERRVARREGDGRSKEVMFTKRRRAVKNPLVGHVHEKVVMAERKSAPSFGMETGAS